MTRPRRLVVVGGTATDVGKTWVAVRLATVLRGLGRSVVARKPAQSFDAGQLPTDADLLGAATGEDPCGVCPRHRWYEMAAAPFMAAEMLGRAPFGLADLVGEIAFPPWEADVGVIETAGGVRSPISSDGADAVDLAAALGCDQVILVAGAGLGAINNVRLCLSALEGFEVAVFLNRFDVADDLQRRNRSWLAGHTGARVVTTVAELGRLVSATQGRGR